MWQELKEKFKNADLSNYPYHIGITGRKAETKQTEAYLEYRRNWVLYPKKRIVPEFPLCVDIEPAFSCNLKCTMCYTHEIPGYYGRKFSDCLMKFGTAQKIIDEGALFNLPSIKYTGRGEALLNPHLAEMISYSKEKGIIDTMFNTNATLLDEFWARKLVKAGLDMIIISLDGISADVYENIRKGASFVKVVKNIEAFVEIRDRLESAWPQLRIQIVCMQENKNEIFDFIGRWQKIANTINLIRFRSFTDMLHDKRSLYRGKIQKVPCRQLWQRLYIAYNGDIHMCCADYQGQEILGNIANDSIYSVWHSNRLNEIRQYHLDGEYYKISLCEKCPSNFEADFWGWLDEEERL